MSPPASSTNGENGGTKRAKTDETTHTSDTNGTGDNSSMKVQDFMSFLAKEANITCAPVRYPLFGLNQYSH